MLSEQKGLVEEWEEEEAERLRRGGGCGAETNRRMCDRERMNSV